MSKKSESMKEKYEFPFNEELPLGSEKFDVKNLHARHKICYFPKTNTIVLKTGYLAVKLDKRLKDLGEFEELSKTDAPQRFPDKFTDSSIGELYRDEKIYVASVQLSARQMLFCRQHGAVATYIRSLIEKEIKAESSKTDHQ